MNKIDYRKNVVVKNSGIHGKGIFSTVSIPKGSKILDIKGEIIDGDECERREEEENNVYIFWNGDDCYIDTKRTRKIKYINHNCDFNCDVIEDSNSGLVLIAYKSIKPGTELTIDYGYEDIYDECECGVCVDDDEQSPAVQGST
jgi:SET domain-containing protein